MKNTFKNLLNSSESAIKYWWLLLILGAASFILGIIVFIFPTISYFTMTIIFSWMILFSGIAQIVLYATNKHIITARGWMLAGGVIETILGMVLVLSISYSAAVLPFFLAFWLLFRSFSLIGFGSDLKALNVPGGVLTIVTGILLMITSIMILVQPLIFGVELVLIWVSISLLIAGVSAISFAIQLRRSHNISTIA